MKYFFSNPSQLKCRLTFLLFFFLSMNVFCSEGEKNVLKQAERLFHEGCFQDAMPIYLQSLLTSSHELQPSEIHLRIACCLLQLQQPIEALETLLFVDSSTQTPPFFLLKSVALQQSGNVDSALQVLHEVDKKMSSDFCENDIAFEMGLLYEAQNDYPNALLSFKKVCWQAENPIPYFLALLHLAKIEWKSHRFDCADNALVTLTQKLPLGHPLEIEKDYLQGMVFSAKQEWQASVDSFERVLTKTSKENKKLLVSVLHALIPCYMTLCMESEVNLTPSIDSKIENYVNQLLEHDSSPSTYLLASHFYLMKSFFYQDETSRQQAIHLLDTAGLFISDEMNIPATLTMAQLITNYEERERLYEQIFNHSLPTELCFKAWFLRGLHHYEEGMCQKLNSPKGLACLKKAVSAFQNALSLQNSVYDSFSFISHPYLVLATRKLEGLFAMALGDYVKADQIFEQYITSYPTSTALGEIYYWRAFIAEKCGDIPKKRKFLSEVFSAYSKSPFAPLAYFHYYSPQEYLRNNRHAMKHLQTMPRIFPSHPYLMYAYYLLGLSSAKDVFSDSGELIHTQDLHTTIEYLSRAEEIFPLLFEKAADPKLINDLCILFYRAQIERAHANHRIAQTSQGGKKTIFMQYTQEILSNIIQAFQSPSSAAKRILAFDPYPSLLREAEYFLALVYKENNCFSSADELVNDSLEKHIKLAPHDVYGMTRLWAYKGELAQTQKKYGLAVQSYLEADKCYAKNEKFLSEERLHVWIQQSTCQKELGHFDEAMTLLSQVINAEIVSPLRMQAMFMRAEIYEQQSRPELALKQLQAIAKREGVWAIKAQEKLDANYVY